MAESSAVPALPGLAVASLEWLPSGAESGLVRVRGSWTEEAAPEPDLPVLAVRAAGAEHRFDSLPDARFARDPSTWRGTYLVPAELVDSDPEAMWLEWPSGARSGLPALTRGVEPPPVPAAPERPEEPVEPGGQVIDRAVLAERRARRAEAAEQAQARVAAEALKAVEVLELRSAELERRLEEATAGAREAEAAGAARRSPPRSHPPPRCGRARANGGCVCGRARSRAPETPSASRCWSPSERRARPRSGPPCRSEALSSRPRGGSSPRRARRPPPPAPSSRTPTGAARGSSRRWLRFTLRPTSSAGKSRRNVRLTSRPAPRPRRHAATRRAYGLAPESLEAALAAAEARLQTTEAGLAAAEARLRVETVARSTLEDELDRDRVRPSRSSSSARGGDEAD